MSAFRLYARYYDLLYSDKNYAAESKFVFDRMRKFVPGCQNVLELGCGTGAHAEWLARAGCEVFGVDLSQGMVQRAQARRADLIPGPGARLHFRHGDARSFRVDQKFDVVLALFHVMSYQVFDEELVDTFATAAAHLNPGGIFLFDYWYGPAVLAQKPQSRVKVLEDEHIHVTRHAEAQLREDEDAVHVQYHVDIKDKAGGKDETVDETHRMRYLWPERLPEVQGPDFEHCLTTGWMSEEPPTKDTWGAVTVLRKKA